MRDKVIKPSPKYEKHSRKSHFRSQNPSFIRDTIQRQLTARENPKIPNRLNDRSEFNFYSRVDVVNYVNGLLSTPDKLAGIY